MFEELNKINHKPKAFEFYTTILMWNDEHVSKQMLDLHLKEDIELASRTRKFMDKSIKWILNHFNITKNSSICDFGCGPGLYTKEFAKTGAKVSGIDFSKRSIEYAKNIANKENLSINYYNQNYLDFKTDEKFDLITMIFCDFCALNPAQRKTLLDKFYRFLKNDGRILLDVFSYNKFKSIDENVNYEYSKENGFWSAKPYHIFNNIMKYEEEKIILFKHTIIEKNNRKNIYNWLQFFDNKSFENELTESKLRIKENYSDVSGKDFSLDSAEIAFVLEKIA